MTPKEKAVELVNKYLQVYDGRVSFAKHCALIAVDEILNNFGQLTDGANFYTIYDAIKFYKEVKQEIEKL
jgi:hypothetical protein